MFFDNIRAMIVGDAEDIAVTRDPVNGCNRIIALLELLFDDRILIVQDPRPFFQMPMKLGKFWCLDTRIVESGEEEPETLRHCQDWTKFQR
jgi:hypothetical protein